MTDSGGGPRVTYRTRPAPPPRGAAAAYDGRDGHGVPGLGGWRDLRGWLRSAGDWMRPRRAAVIAGAVALVLVAPLIAGLLIEGTSRPQPGGLGSDGRLALAVFVVAVWAWAFTKLDDTYIALGAATALVGARVIRSDELFGTLGDDTIWLLVGAFVIASAVSASGLAARWAAWMISGATTPRQLVHLVTAVLVATTYAVPATSGRAALTVPVFLAVAHALQGSAAAGALPRDSADRLVKALSLVFPTVILLSAVGSLVGAGAHLVTSRVVATATGQGFTFAGWLMLGLPLAVVNCHLAAELVLRLFTRPDDRRSRLRITVADVGRHVETPVSGPLTVREGRAALLVVVMVVLWCTAELHGVHPAIVAVAGALVATSPRYGAVTLKTSLRTVPWSLLLFMAATLALGDALLTSGAAAWLAHSVFAAFGVESVGAFLVAVVVISAAAHLLIQSRSARSAVLVPIVVATAPAMGVAPAAAAFASTAAAGFCHTLPSSAKPVAMFAAIEGVPTYAPPDLRRLSMWLGPMTALLVIVFAVAVWPALGLPLT